MHSGGDVRRESSADRMVEVKRASSMSQGMSKVTPALRDSLRVGASLRLAEAEWQESNITV